MNKREVKASGLAEEMATLADNHLHTCLKVEWFDSYGEMPDLIHLQPPDAVTIYYDKDGIWAAHVSGFEHGTTVGIEWFANLQDGDCTILRHGHARMLFFDAIESDKLKYVVFRKSMRGKWIPD